MSNTIYWAVLLNEQTINKLKASSQPVHPNIYLEHVTLCFNPTEEQDIKWMERLGEEVTLTVIGRGTDEKGDAFVIDGIEREDSGIPHITISCADGTKPFYSNALLLGGGHETIWPFEIKGVISRYTKKGWDSGHG